MLPTPPLLVPMTRITVGVAGVTSLGAAPQGERRFVPLLGGVVQGPELTGTVVQGGVDWQWARADGVLEIAAHYVICATDGSLIEVKSDGLRHGPPQVMARLARGEAVGPGEYFFRTLMRFTTGAPAWVHLNQVMALAVGQRDAGRVALDVYRIT
jgi:Protein of unknown function (DUF3237)